MRWIDPGREIISVWINIVLDNVLLILKKSSEQALLEGLHAYMVGDEGFEPPTLTL